MMTIRGLGVTLGILVVVSVCGTTLGESKTVKVRVQVDSEAPNYEGFYALDGDPESMWHTKWQTGETKHPHEIIIDLGKPYAIEGFRYLPRRGGGNGTILDYECYVSNDPKDFGEPIVKRRFQKPRTQSVVRFAAKRTGRYFRIRALSEVNGRPWTSIAELNILSDGVQFRAASLPTVGPDDGTVSGAMELARQTLALVERSAPLPKLAAALRGLESKVVSADENDEELYNRVRKLRRRIILSHPLLDFDKLLINKRPPPKFAHQSDQYLGRYSGVGDGLVVLDNWKENPEETVLLEGKLPPGSVLHPDLSFDGKRIMFSYCDHTPKDPKLRRFFIYETNVDGTGQRQLTGTALDPMTTWHGRRTVLIEDWDPCYLPDGGFAFISTRNQGGVRCHHGGRYCPTYMLYRADADGSNIRQMSYGEANEWDPSVLHDGRIIWTRWDYINRHDTVYQSLWTTRPDGTGTATFYGNYSRNPCSIAEARAIPGSRKVVATTTAHHFYTSGSIIAIDPLKGQDGYEPLTRITPEASFPETERYPRMGFATPWPLSEDLFLVAYSPQYRAKTNSYSIYLIDTLGGRELIYRDPRMSCFAPIPIVPRPTPPELPSRLVAKPKDETGVFYVQNVYQSTQPIPRGSVKHLRVVRLYPQTTIRVPDRSLVLFETAKKVLGTVPVAEDCSVAFRAPAGEPLLFQLLDENYMCVMSMRTFVYLHPGERVSCVGCHEPRQTTPPAQPIPHDAEVHEIQPPPGPQYIGGLSFAKTVQPVLDHHCIQCHGLSKTEGNINLLGTIDPIWPPRLGNVKPSQAYNSLTRRKGLVSVALRNQETPYSKPKDYFSHAGRLAPMLLNGDENHESLKQRDPKGFRRIVQWLDLNAQFYGDYSWNKVEWRKPDPAGEKALREHIAEAFGPELAAQPFTALVNVALPSESRILKAPLAVNGGGWGQVAEGAWRNINDAGYWKMRRLVEASIAPREFRDIEGTCARPKCECRSCWVRKAEKEYRKKLAVKNP